MSFFQSGSNARSVYHSIQEFDARRLILRSPFGRLFLPLSGLPLGSFCFCSNSMPPSPIHLPACFFSIVLFSWRGKESKLAIGMYTRYGVGIRTRGARRQKQVSQAGELREQGGENGKNRTKGKHSGDPDG
ncbi:hypothetical protein IE53DRAFT_245492 [Violaceomyces palustris]|uniref:Uncharacterized protein n=1 Tax=Violaceomyces palustris TaxID=1673888 RepID=A0ACD0NNY1_9BASI|nr:hypothetical protein IE53DRAFT_245492 [Violaceomyces palustris]